MSAIQELAPFIGAYHRKIRNAKDRSGMTLEELSEKSGVSFSTVSRLYAEHKRIHGFITRPQYVKRLVCRSTSCLALKISSEARKS